MGVVPLPIHAQDGGAPGRINQCAAILADTTPNPRPNPVRAAGSDRLPWSESRIAQTRGAVDFRPCVLRALVRGFRAGELQDGGPPQLDGASLPFLDPWGGGDFSRRARKQTATE